MHNLILICMWRQFQPMFATWWWLKAFFSSRAVIFWAVHVKLLPKQRTCRMRFGKTFSIFSTGDVLSSTVVVVTSSS